VIVFLKQYIMLLYKKDCRLCSHIASLVIIFIKLT